MNIAFRILDRASSPCMKDSILTEHEAIKCAQRISWGEYRAEPTDFVTIQKQVLEHLIARATRPHD